jgi:transcriptional regulator with XRE-family HTH domain
LLVRRLLEERGITQAAFSARCGLSKDHVSRILRGSVPFPRGRRTLLRMARAFEIAPERFAEFVASQGAATPSARSVVSRLVAAGIDLDAFRERVPRYSAGHLRAILAGRAAFPRDRAAIAEIALACGAQPQEFSEFLPSAQERERWLEAARLALDPEDFGVYRHLTEKIARTLRKDAP